MSLPFTSLDTATAVGPGASEDLGGAYDHHTMVVFKTGGGAVSVRLEGSHDDVNWFSLGTVGFSSPSADEAMVLTAAPVSGSPGHLVRYLRAYWVNLAGGTSPTVTATIATDTTGED